MKIMVFSKQRIKKWKKTFFFSNCFQKEVKVFRKRENSLKRNTFLIGSNICLFLYIFMPSLSPYVLPRPSFVEFVPKNEYCTWSRGRRDESAHFSTAPRAGGGGGGGRRKNKNKKVLRIAIFKACFFLWTLFSEPLKHLREYCKNFLGSLQDHTHQIDSQQ